MRAFIPVIADQLLRDIYKTYKETSEISDDLLRAARFIFGSHVIEALDLIDQEAVSCLSSPSGRKIFKVIGGSGRMKICFASCCFCSCWTFEQIMLEAKEEPMCKHILAVHLHEALAVTRQETVTDEEMTSLLIGTMDSSHSSQSTPEDSP